MTTDCPLHSEVAPTASARPCGVAVGAPSSVQQGSLADGRQTPCTAPDALRSGNGAPALDGYERSICTGQLPEHTACVAVSKHASTDCAPAVIETKTSWPIAALPGGGKLSAWTVPPTPMEYGWPGHA